MKKAFAWLMLLMAITLFSVAAVPVKADLVSKPLFAGSPHYWGEPGPKDNPDWYNAHKTKVGVVDVWNDDDYLYVKYNTTYSGIGIHETHLAVVTDPADFPMTKSGNPKVGKFPFKHEGLSGVTDMYTIPHDFDAGTVLFIAAHAALCNGETAWADCGGRNAYFPGGNWATYFTYIVQ